MVFFEILLWVSLGAILYSYALYPLLLIACNAARSARSDWRYVSGGGSRRAGALRESPRVDVLVAAYNERQHIAERIHNLCASDYAPDRLTIRVGSDGSDDGTVAAAEAAMAAHPDRSIDLAAFEARRGKPSVMNDLVARSDAEIIVFTDANTSFTPEAISRLVRHFEDPEIGCVCGELRLEAAGGTENRDHIYWRYERFLKFQESRLGALLGANGGVYAVRRSLYEAIPANTVVDDFWISMALTERGWKNRYDPEAVAIEDVPERIADEFGRRVRIGAGNYQALRRFWRVLDPRRGYLALAFFSHKVLRWFVPHFMVLALIANLALLAVPGYRWLFLAQVGFYATAWIGNRLSRRGGAPAVLRLPLFFVSMNLALLLGCKRYLSGRVGGAWARTAR